MKIILTFLFAFCTIALSAQTYTVVIDGRLPPGQTFPTISWGDGTSTVTGGNVNYTFRNFDRGGSQNENVQFYEELTNRSFTSLILRTTYSPVPGGCTPPSPNSITVPANELIPTTTGGGSGFNYCSAFFSVDAVPEMTITGTTGTVCAGSTIDLLNTQNFPNEAYTWNFRVRNSSGTIVTGGGVIPSTYYSANLKGASFTMIDLLGTDLEDNIGNTVEFYLGANGFIFSNSVSIVIDDCTPLLDERYPENTSCSDSADGSVEVALLSGLDNTQNERLFVVINGVTPEGFVIPERSVRITSLVSSGNGANTFSLPDLEAGTYQIEYQSEIDPEGDGTYVPNGLGIPFNFDIQSPSAVVIDNLVSVQEASCPGDLASIRVEVSGGQDFESGIYQYTKDGGTSWQTSANPNSITYDDLMPGSNYTFGAKIVFPSGEECISNSSIDRSIPAITNPLVLASGTQIDQQPSSAGATDGIIFVQVTGGSTDFTFELYSTSDVNNPIATQTQTSRIYRFENLGVGNYFVRVADANGCDVNNQSTPFELAAAPLPTLGTPTLTNPSCEGANDGSVTVTVSYPTSTTFFYELRIGTSVERSGNTTTNEINITGLPAGNYILYVIAATGDFSDSDTVVSTNTPINDPAVVTIDSFSPNNTSCFDTDDGSIGVTASGGLSYEYSLVLVPDPGDWFPLVANTISNLPAGFYDLTLRNENGCESNTINNIFVDEPAEILISEVSSNDVTTNGGADGSLEISVSGGITPYQYEWSKDGSPYTPSASSTDTNLLDLEAGTYQVTVTDDDGNGCSASLSAPIVITEPGPLAIISLTATNVLCRGQNTGSITAEVTGTAPFTYSWELQGDNTFSAPNEPTISNLFAGTYTLVLRDATTSPEVTSTITITEPAEVLSASAIPTDTQCFAGNDGSIQVTAIGGTTPYQYSIDDGFSFQSVDTFTRLSANSYEILVLDANDCEFRVSALVNEPDELAITVDDVTNATTAGGADGTISISVLGGTPPYNYSWTGPDGYTNNADEDLTGLQAGDYDPTVTDSNGCNASLLFPITVSEPGPLSIISLSGTDVDCKGEATGSITANVTGTPPFNYVWERQGDATFTAPNQPTINDLTAGTYVLTLTDASTNPEVMDTVVISEPVDELSATAIPTDVSCFGGTDGAVQINAIGGTPPYEYSIDNGTTYQSGNIFSGLASGNYDVIVRDGNGCETTAFAGVIQPQQLVLVIDEQKSLSAAGATDGAISITVGGGTAPYTYEWFADNGFTSTDEDIQDLAGGNYTVIVRDSNWGDDSDGCTLVQDFLIAEPGELTVTLTQTVFLECNGDDFAEITANVQGGVAPYTLEWFKVENGSNTALTEDTEILGSLSQGEYFITVTDANGITIDSDPITITEPDLLDIVIDSTTDVLCSGDETGAIEISIIGGTPPYIYFWSNGATTQDLNNIAAGDYTLEIADANGCLAEETITINTPPDALQITNANINNVSEYEANDGSISLELSGGAQPYVIIWIRLSDNSFVSDQSAISGLAADSYQVTVSDDNGCTVVENYEVTQPDIVEETIIPPTCTGDSDGSISLLVNRGNGTFTYNWSTGDTTSSISNLSAGTYTVTITGFGNGPLTRTYVVEDPAPLEVDLGEDRVLCQAQELILDVSVEDENATYSWTSDTGFSSSEASISVTETGNYTVVVQTASGCSATGSIFVEATTGEINAEFAMSSQIFVGEALVAVDISYPLPDNLEWIIPEEATVVNQNKDELELWFTEAGEYEIGIITYKGSCIATQVKKVLVVERDGTVGEDARQDTSKRIDDFILYPNPTDGKFTAEVTLSERANISIKVFNFANNALMASEKDRGKTAYSIPFDLSALPSGVYAVLLETPYGNRLQKVIVR